MSDWQSIETALGDDGPAAKGQPVLLYVPNFNDTGSSWTDRPDEMTNVHTVVGCYRGRQWDQSGVWVCDITWLDDSGCYYAGDTPSKVPLHIFPSHWKPLDAPPVIVEHEQAPQDSHFIAGIRRPRLTIG